MIDDLQAKFMRRFSAQARSRVTNALETATRGDHAAMAIVARELHALAGEAGLLGIAEVVPLARDGEDHARRMATERTSESVEAAIATLRTLESVLDRLQV